MAKKAKKKLEEAEEAKSFRFPDFDERKFLAHEYEQSIATLIAVGVAVGLSTLSWAIDRTSIPLVVPWVVGVAGIVATPWLVRTVRPLASEYTKGDWAWIILTTLFGWLGIWFLFLNLFPL